MQRAYAERARLDLLPASPHGSWTRLAHRAALLRRRESEGPPSSRALADLQRRAFACQADVDAYVERLRNWVRRPPPPTLRDLYAELVALEDEFGEAEIDVQSPTLAVVTEPIELEGVELGPFRILLRCGSVEEPEYETIALVAHEPSSSDFANVTHPHVRDDALCEGAGHEAIQAAFRAGRLCDFFALVRQVLRTYNPGSAYARLGEWQGVECTDCGGRTEEERVLVCSQCDNSICFDCSRSCTGCDRDLCGCCAENCSACGNRFCSACLSESSGAGGGLCTDCFEERENEREELEEERADDESGEPATAEPE
jgi:hypothetical protein